MKNLKTKNRRYSKNESFNTVKLLILCILLAASSSSGFAQEISYKVISNDARIPKMQLFLIPIDVKAQDGLNAGLGGQFDFRPIQRLGLRAQATSSVYANPYRSDYEDIDPNGFKKMGGLSLNVVGEFNWRKKGLSYKDGKDGKFLLEHSVSGRYETTKYIPYRFNILMERSLRAGIYYDNFAIVNNTSSTTALSFGIGKKWHRRAELDFGDRTDFQSNTTSWSFDVLYGTATYESDSVKAGDPFGARMVLERNQIFSKRPGLRGFKYNYQLEVGFRPGNTPPYISMRLGFPLFTVQGSYIDDVEYKQIKRPRKLLGKFFRAI
jgi:hypothetical protein